ncbi:hypothetical protein CK203_092730 [Vitis vinifera]|uniref:Uncharacterized protein n=1 Tax=Vitis vinifera TaxID=29760 RepID=A0A438D890_VITVI|nr:hypothetical protein CK203_092730 [Vitis vinifera]
MTDFIYLLNMLLQIDNLIPFSLRVYCCKNGSAWVALVQISGYNSVFKKDQNLSVEHQKSQHSHSKTNLSGFIVCTVVAAAGC